MLIICALEATGMASGASANKRKIAEHKRRM
jgi:hypothetical protein